MTKRMDEVKRLEMHPLQEIYERMEEVLSEELRAADSLHRGVPGWKVAFTRMRVKLSEVSKLCKEARKELLAMKKNEEEKEMEKYGVEEDDDLSKNSADGCPACNKAVETHGGVRKCPDCGTEPFESNE